MGHYFPGFLAPIWLSGRCPTAPIIPFPGAASLCPFPPASAWRSLCACPLSRAPDYVLGHVLDGRCMSGNLLMRLLWPVFLLEVAMLPTVPIWLSGRCHRLVTPLFESCPVHCEAHAWVITLQASCSVLLLPSSSPPSLPPFSAALFAVGRSVGCAPGLIRISLSSLAVSRSLGRTVPLSAPRAESQ